APGETANFTQGKNIAITRTGNSIAVATADDVNFTNVNVSNNLDVDGDTYLGDNFSVVNNEAFYNVEPNQITNDYSVVNKKYVDGIETHYYSVNDGGIQQGNYANDGATGVNSTAIGMNSEATSQGATAIAGGKAGGITALAVGYGARADGEGAVALGSHNVVWENGFQSQAVGSFNTLDGLRNNAFGYNNFVGMDAPSTYTNVFGSENQVSADNATALGNRNNVRAENAVVLGNDVTLAATVPGATALGTNSSVTVANGVALGSGSLSNREAYTVLGYDPLVGGDYNGSTSSTWVGTSGSVGVGNLDLDITRQITGVAAGSEDTDAVNVAQLKSLGNVPLTFAGDSGSEFDRKLGETTNVKGGNTGTLTDGNIGVVADGTDTLNIKLAENVDLGTNGSVVMGDTTVNNNGLTINGGPSVTNAGIDGGDNQITGVGSGLDGQELADITGDDLNNAVNVGDLQDVSTAGNGGGFGLADASDAEVKQDLGATIKVHDPDGNIVTVADNATGELQLGLSNALSVGEAGP
ncbi:hypothetical protein ACPA0G_18810, partial [Vreelandella venusta]